MNPLSAHPKNRLWPYWLGLACLLSILFCLELCLGQVKIPLSDVVSILSGNQEAHSGWRNIILLYRLPRAITAALAGAGLGAAGLAMQTLFRNPLAEPYVLGVSAGAHLGVALLVLAAGGLGFAVFGERAGILGNFSLVFAAGAGAGLVMLVVMGLAQKVSDNVTLLVVGLMFGYVSSSLVSILMQLALEHQMQAYMSWTFGTFGQVTWRQMRYFAPVIVCGLALGSFLIKPLNALLLGPEYARSMGLVIERSRNMIIVMTAILAAAVTAYCGPIGFLGIAIPHLCRVLFKTSDHRILMPGVYLSGAGLAMAADLIAQVPGGKTPLPLNAVTALIGAPVVIAVLLKRKPRLGS